MATFWFISAPLVSHTDWGGYLKTALALKQLGHTVVWVSEPRIGGFVGSAGIDFAPIGQTGWLWPPPPAPNLTSIPPAEAVMLRYRRALDTWLSEDIVGEAVEALLKLAAQQSTPDVIVTDPFLTASALAAEKLDIPLAVAGWPALDSLNEEFLYPVQRTLGQDSQDRIARLLERFGLQGANFSRGPTPAILSPHLHVSYFSETWYQADSAHLLDQTLFVGGVPETPADAPPAWLTEISDSQPLALITLGTIFTGDLGFFSWAAHAASRVGYVPLVVLGWNPIEPDEKAKLKAALPKNSRLLNWVDFRHVLPRTRLIIHHGGMGTTHAAVVYGVPQMVVPHAADQRGQARRVAQSKVGLNLTAFDVQKGALLEGARALAADTRVQQNVSDLAAEFALLGGVERAASALATLVT